MRHMVASLAVLGLTGPAFVPAAAAQTQHVAIDRALRLIDCADPLQYNASGDVPTVTCPRTSSGVSRSYNLTQDENRAVAFMGVSLLSPPWFAAFGYDAAEGACGVLFSQTTRPGILPRADGYLLWDNAQIDRGGQPRRVSLADLRRDAPGCTRQMLLTYDSAVSTLGPL